MMRRAGSRLTMTPRRVLALTLLTVMLSVAASPTLAAGPFGQGTQEGQGTQSVGPTNPGDPTTGSAPPSDLPTVTSLDDLANMFPPEVSAVLVIDVSGSMGGNSKMADAKNAAKETLARFLTFGINSSAPAAATRPTAPATPARVPAAVGAPITMDERLTKLDELVTALQKLQGEAGNPADWALEDTRRMRGLMAQMDTLMKDVVLPKTEPVLQRLNPLVEKMHFAIAGRVGTTLGGNHYYMVSGKKSSAPGFGGLYASKMSDHDAIYLGAKATTARNLHTRLAGEMYGPDWLVRTDSCMESGHLTFQRTVTSQARANRFRGYVGPGTNNDWMRSGVSGQGWVVDYVVEKGELIDLDRFTAAGDAEVPGVRRALSEALPDVRQHMDFDTRSMRDLGYGLGAASDFERQFSLNVARKLRAGESAASAVQQMEKYLPRFESVRNLASQDLPAEFRTLGDEIANAARIYNEGGDPGNVQALMNRFNAYRGHVREVAATHQANRYSSLVDEARQLAQGGDAAASRAVMEQAAELLDDTQGALHNYHQLGTVSGQGPMIEQTLDAFRGAGAKYPMADIMEDRLTRPWALDDRTIAQTVAEETIAGQNPARRFRSGIMRRLEDAKDFVANNRGASFVYVAGMGYVGSQVYDAMQKGDFKEVQRLVGETATTELAPAMASYMLGGEAVGAAAGAAGSFGAGLTAAVAFNVGYWVSNEIKERRQNWAAEKTATELFSGYTEDNRRPAGYDSGLLDQLGLPVDESALLNQFTPGIHGDKKVEVDPNAKTVTISTREIKWTGGRDPMPVEVWEPEEISFAEIKMQAQLGQAFHKFRGDYKAALRNGLAESGVVSSGYEYSSGMASLPPVRIANPDGALTETEFNFYRDQFDDAFGRMTLGQNTDLENLFRAKAQMFERFIGSVAAGKRQDQAAQQRLANMDSDQLAALKQTIEAGAEIRIDGAVVTAEDMQRRIDLARSTEDGFLAQAIADFKASQVSDATRKEVDVLTNLPALGGVSAPGTFEFAVLAYSGGCNDGNDYFPFTRDYAPLAGAIDALSPGGSTPMTPALYQADRIIQVDGKGKRGVIVLLTDGQNSCSDSPTEAADRIFQRTVGAAGSVPGSGAPGGPGGMPFLLVTPSWIQTTPTSRYAAAGYSRIDQNYGTVAAGRSPIPVTVSTIGFQVTDQQQTALEQVAAAGGGQAVRAENMAQLAGAFQAAVGAAAPAPVVASGGGGMVLPRQSGPSWMMIGLIVVVLGNVGLIGAILWMNYGRSVAPTTAAPPVPVARTLLAIQVVYPDGRRKSGHLDITTVAVIGRSESCDLVLNDSSVSSRHLEVLPGTGGALVRDLDSTNGTTRNGESVRNATVSAGDELVLGDVRLKIGALTGS